MATISTENTVINMIEVIPIKPENQQKLLDILIDLTENIIKHMPGFVSASFHKSLDQTKIVTYAQWENREAWEAMVKNPKVHPHLRKIEEIQITANNHALYD